MLKNNVNSSCFPCIFYPYFLAAKISDQDWTLYVSLGLELHVII